MFGHTIRRFVAVSVLSFIVFYSLPNPVFALNVFTFSTDTQNISVDTLSDKITLHSEAPVTETTYIMFLSSSNTGQFYSNTTTADPIVPNSYVYISTNSSNRTVYYKDTTSGDITLTANIYNKEKTLQIGSVSQHIIVVGQTTSNSTSTASTSTPTETNNYQNNNSYLSSHSSYVELSGYNPPEKLSATMGRNRLSTVGINTEFNAESNITASNVSYEWSFGDGSSGTGKRVEHVYDFPGDYVVVLNVHYFGEVSVSRATIKVVEPKLIITEVNPNYIKIKNDSAFEVNLYGWKLFYKGMAFAFPVDTIILAGASTEFSSRITGFKPTSLSEVSLNINNAESQMTFQKNILIEPKNDISTIYEKAKLIQNELALMQVVDKPKNINQTATPLLSLNISTTTQKTNNDWLSKLKRFLFKRN
ncbi:MAG: PKD domain-containing protein [Minisyncoccia bacterium]